MLRVSPYIELDNTVPNLGTSDAAFGLECAFRELLTAAQVALGEDADFEPRMVFEVCVDGQNYSVSIVEFPPDTDETRPHLSPREMDIARLIAKGLPTKTIAVRLGLRPCTVSTYTKRIYLKLNVNSRAEMVAKMLNEYGLGFYPTVSAKNAN
jgi:DNA-binding NarL/FixJ family response regulator